jgi:hypothetical protein
MSLIHALSTQISSGTDVGAATMLVLREFSALVDAETVSNAIDLIVSAADIIIDTRIQTVSPKLSTSSSTPVRMILST